MAVTVAQTSPFLTAARGQRASHTPVWFMRQAGRYLPEYRAVRERHTLLEICAAPSLAAAVTLQPVRRLGVDAAILFADILLPLVPMGLDLTFAKGEGPVITNPVRGAADVAHLAAVDVRDALAPVLETVRQVRRELDDATPLIGFAGGPFTVACYAIEGGSSRHFVAAKRLMYEAPAAWHELMRRLVTVLGDYLAAQVEAGAQALQLFDSWVGALGPDDYQRYVMPYSRQLFDRLRATGVPLIHFGVETGSLLELMRDAGGDVIGVDWRVPLDEARKRIGVRHALQGNLDPVALFAPLAELRGKVRDVLRHAGAGEGGHIFNLGHGVLPDTPVDHVRAVVDLVHELTA